MNRFESGFGYAVCATESPVATPSATTAKAAAAAALVRPREITFMMLSPSLEELK
jgi:hypothetical protein